MQKNTILTTDLENPSTSESTLPEPSFYHNLSWEEVEPLINQHLVQRIQRSGVYRFNSMCAQSSLYHGYFDWIEMGEMVEDLYEGSKLMEVFMGYDVETTCRIESLEAYRSDADAIVWREVPKE